MLVREQDNVRLGHIGIVSLSADRIHMNRFAVECEHERSVPDEGDSQVAGAGLDNVLLEFRLQPGLQNLFVKVAKRETFIDDDVSAIRQD